MKDMNFHHHLTYPPPKHPLRVSLVIREDNQDGMTNGSLFLMDQMFKKDPRMQCLQEEGPKLVFDLLDRYSNVVTKLDGPRDVLGLAAFLSMKVEMPIATLLKKSNIVV